MKKLLYSILVTILILLFTSLSFGAATCAVDEAWVGDIYVLKFTWTAHTDGAVASGTCDETTDNELKDVTGKIIGAHFYPHATNPPDNGYDVFINTTGGADITFAAGTDLTNDDSVTTQWQTPLTADSFPPIIYMEDLDLVVGDAGASNQGVVYLFMTTKE